MNYPDWVEKHKEKSTSVKRIGDSYYLYRVTSERVAGKKHPVSRQTYTGKITEKGVERAGLRIVPEKTIGKTLGKLVPSVDVHLRDVVLIKTDGGWMYTQVSDEIKAELKGLGLYECGFLSMKGEE